jgi:hypothetical protein
MIVDVSSRRLLLVPLTFLFALAGCGESDERSDREKVKQVLSDSIEAAHAGDEEKACSLYTPGYVREIFREKQEPRPAGVSCREVLRSFEPVLRQLTPDPNPRVTEIRVRGATGTARLEIETHLGPAAGKVFLSRRDGDWKIDHLRDYPDETPPAGVGL